MQTYIVLTLLTGALLIADIVSGAVKGPFQGTAATSDATPDSDQAAGDSEDEASEPQPGPMEVFTMED